MIMFTGIVEELGKIKSFERFSNGAKLTVECNDILSDIKIGDSICVNGVCQTVTDYNSSSFSVMLSDETLNVTNFSDVKQGDYINLESALTLSSRLGGHIVSGHIDCIGRLVSVEKLSDFYDIEFEIPHENSKYIVYKGSITINGISLTVAKVDENRFTVAIIPHTYENTVLKYLKTGDCVNIETDILAKYVEKLLGFSDNKTKDTISMEFLKDNGFV